MVSVQVRSARMFAGGLFWCWLLLLILGMASWCSAGVFLFADQDDVESMTHPPGYRGTGGPLSLGVCIDARSANAEAMVIPVENAVKSWNQLKPTTQNIDFDRNNGLASHQVDFESVILHELGHCLGLGHPNAATESGLAGPAQNYTRTTAGRNDVFDIDPGPDGIIGSSDDRRGDDVNLHWFRVVNNNPFTIDTVVDATTYSRDPADLPPAHTFAANADSEVGAMLGFPHTEAVMQQGAFLGEAQRQLSHDDVATLKLGMSGVDTIAGTEDDYTVTLVARGLVDQPGSAPGCNIIVDFDEDETRFAVCKVHGRSLNADHVRITSARIYFHDGFQWFFNQELVQVDEADLAIAQSIAPAAANDTEQVSYTFTVTNHGPTSATNVTVTNQVPRGVEVLDVAFARGVCNDGDGVVTCAVETLSPDETVAGTIVVRPTAVAERTSTASVTGNERDPDLSNNTDVLGIATSGESAKGLGGGGGGGCTLRPGAAFAFPLLEPVLCLVFMLGWKLRPRREGTSHLGTGGILSS